MQALAVVAMKSKFLVVVMVLGLSSLEARQIDVTSGGFSVQTPSDPKLTGRELAPEAPPNALFPRIHGRDFFLDAVSWGKWDPEDPLSDVLKKRSKASGLSYSDAMPFTTRTGLTGVRFLLKPEEPVKQIALHRFIFRNNQNEVICIGTYGKVSEVEALLESIALLNEI